MQRMDSDTQVKTYCTHCGDICTEEVIVQEDLHFCCHGCQQVYKLLHDHDMMSFYAMEKNPGVSMRGAKSKDFDILDDPSVISRLVSFSDGGTTRITLSLPAIHCSSCIYLLEHIHNILDGITSSRVNFLKKQVTIIFDNSRIDLKQIVLFLDKIGYSPHITLGHIENTSSEYKPSKSLWYKIGLTGFSFGNIMLLSFPEYLGFDKASLLFYVGYINIVLAIPVLVYSARDYLISAWKSLQMSQLNIDVPVAIGMITLFTKSVYDILSGSGEGYLDSFAGFVFFLLIGKWFQKYTHQSLSFERNYTAYFPISTKVLRNQEWISIPLDRLEVGDRILVRNGELIPTDGKILAGNGRIDYSFVTGESSLLRKELGDEVYAGGKQNGASIEVEVDKKVKQSYITQLWNDEAFSNHKSSSTNGLINVISKYFTTVILVIALVTLIYWIIRDTGIALNAFTSVLIVACPCALALAIPFTYGNILRLMTKESFFIKNTETIEQLQDIDHIVFDKTGTLTDSKRINVRYYGKPLTPEMRMWIKSGCTHSSHPLSKAIVCHLAEVTTRDVVSYEEYPGKGFCAEIEGHSLRIGSAKYIFCDQEGKYERGVFIEIDGSYIGYFKMNHHYRKDLKSIISSLQNSYDLSVISGDNADAYQSIVQLFGNSGVYKFEQSPKEKLEYIKSIQAKGKRVMMIGDGLNDAGALQQSDVGIVISDDTNNFTPASDAILAASSFHHLYRYIRYIHRSKYIVYGAFCIAFCYNLIGLYFATSGQLSPVVAAILMPTSSITIILYGVFSSYLGYTMINKKYSKRTQSTPKSL